MVSSCARTGAYKGAAALRCGRAFAQVAGGAVVVAAVFQRTVIASEFFTPDSVPDACPSQHRCGVHIAGKSRQSRLLACAVALLYHKRACPCVFAKIKCSSKRLVTAGGITRVSP